MQHNPWYRQVAESVWSVRAPDAGEDGQDDVRDRTRLPTSPGRAATWKWWRGNTIISDTMIPHLLQELNTNRPI